MIVGSDEAFSEAADDNVIIQDSFFEQNDFFGLTLTDIRGKMELQNCVFYRNRGTPLIAYQSTVQLSKKTVFQDNTSPRGGGLILYNSTVIFGPGSNTQFINNTAQKFGGAIYVVSLPDILSSTLIDFEFEDLPRLSGDPSPANDVLFQRSCFFSYNERDGTQVIFIGNTALLGGLDIYGPTLYTGDCSLTGKSLFRFESTNPSSLQISSDPSRVCFCVDDVPQCEDRTLLVLNETRFPGESFSVPVVLAGYNFGRVAGPVYTSVVDQVYQEVLDEKEHVQPVTLLNCTKLVYEISSVPKTNTSVILQLTAQNQISPINQDLQSSLRDVNSPSCTLSQQPPCLALLTTPIFINITLEDCPLGFELNTTTGMCVCDQVIGNLSNADGTPLTCELQDRVGFISREGTSWIGIDITNQNDTGIYYFFKNCPREYCQLSKIDVDLRNPNVQCGLNRGGVLCGSCHNNYSLQLGSNSCAQCTNNGLSLLIVFAVLGILLVVLITALDLTVASGTINGLIFYANVVWRNNTILYTSQNAATIKYFRIITVPIAWINLDFGIETCFSKNLDQLTKSGLQFVFPVYIWCIAGFIIIVSQYSTRATKLFGRNSVAVLATLFLLSYGKLFRNITDVFNYADISDSDGEKRTVWYLDGNVEYGKSEHIILIVVALIFLFLFVLPFTLLLLLGPFLRAKSNLRSLQWIIKIIPFLDTYTGPFKHKRRYQMWTGILLVARVIILITFAAIPTDRSNVNVLLMVTIATSLLTYMTVVPLLYKKFYLSLLEIAYLFNMVILGGTFLFYQTTSIGEKDERRKGIFVIISVWTVLLQLAGTLIFHTVRRLLSIQKVKAFFKREPKNLDFSSEKNEPTFHIIDVNNVYDSSRFRETLLINMT